MLALVLALLQLSSSQYQVACPVVFAASSSAHWGNPVVFSAPVVTDWISHSTGVNAKVIGTGTWVGVTPKVNALPGHGLTMGQLKYTPDPPNGLDQELAMPTDGIVNWKGIKYGYADAPEQDGDLTRPIDDYIAKTQDAVLKTRLNLKKTNNDNPPEGIYFLVHGPDTDGFSNYPSASHRQPTDTSRYWRVRKPTADFAWEQHRFFLTCGTGGYPGQLHVLVLSDGGDQATWVTWATANNFVALNVVYDSTAPPATPLCPFLQYDTHTKQLSASKTYTVNGGSAEKVDVNIFFHDTGANDHDDKTDTDFKVMSWSGTERFDFVDTDKAKKFFFEQLPSPSLVDKDHSAKYLNPQ